MSNKTSDKNVGSIEKISQTSDKNVSNIEEKKQINTSLGFSIDLERILNHLVEHETYMAMISNIRIRYIGEKEDTANGKRQVFEIERKVEDVKN